MSIKLQEGKVEEEVMKLVCGEGSELLRNSPVISNCLPELLLLLSDWMPVVFSSQRAAHARLRRGHGASTKPSHAERPAGRSSLVGEKRGVKLCI